MQANVKNIAFKSTSNDRPITQQISRPISAPITTPLLQEELLYIPTVRLRWLLGWSLRDLDRPNGSNVISENFKIESCDQRVSPRPGSVKWVTQMDFDRSTVSIDSIGMCFEVENIFGMLRALLMVAMDLNQLLCLLMSISVCFSYHPCLLRCRRFLLKWSINGNFKTCSHFSGRPGVEWSFAYEANYRFSSAAPPSINLFAAQTSSISSMKFMSDALCSINTGQAK